MRIHVITICFVDSKFKECLGLTESSNFIRIIFIYFFWILIKWNRLKRFLHRNGFRNKGRDATIRLINEFFNTLTIEEINNCILGRAQEDGSRNGGFLSRLKTIHYLKGESVQRVTRRTRLQMPPIRKR